MAEPRLKTIGVLGVERGTSHIAAQWAPAINPRPGETRLTGLLMTHVWDKDRGLAEEFARRFAVPHVVDRFDQMAGKVDGVIQSGYKASFWSFELARPYLEAGCAVLIDRPGAYSLARARQILALARKHRALVYWGNNHESHSAVDMLRARAALIAPLTALVADSLADPEPRFYSMHCLHGIYMIHPILAGMIRRVRTYSASDSVFAPCTVFECENRDGSPFVATLQRHGVDRVPHDGLRLPHEARETAFHRGHVKIFGRNGTWQDTLQPPLSYDRAVLEKAPRAPENFHRLFTVPAVAKFDRMIQTGQLPQTEELMFDKLRVFLASWKSLLDGGRVQEATALPEEWTGPNPYPGYFPPGYFGKS